MTFARTDALIPLEAGQSVNAGWTPATGNRPLGVTWHWAACDSLAVCRQTIGGTRAERRGVASAHYGIGRTFEEGIDRYVSIENRSWHAGRNQTIQWDGKPLSSNDLKGTRTTIGIETISIGFWQGTPPRNAEWIEAADTNSRHVMKVQPWPLPQIEMMIAVGKEIVKRWPNIEFRHHHGHHDLCPGYKQDVAGFPFATVLRGIYDKPDIPDVWTRLWMPIERQKVLVALGYLGPNDADGIWGRGSETALRAFQRDQGMLQDGMWTTFVNWKVYDAMTAKAIRGFFDDQGGHMNDLDINVLVQSNAGHLQRMNVAAAGLVSSLLDELRREDRKTYIRLRNPVAEGHKVEYDFVKGDRQLVGTLAKALGFKSCTDTLLEVQSG